MAGPLAGFRVVEMAGIGPTPFAGMVLSDLGADVVRIDRVPREPADIEARQADPLARGRRSVAIELKEPEGPHVALDLIATADVLLEGFRPGVMERLGLGPEACLSRAPKLVYGRMTGWGQHGPSASTPGHDINYLAVAGALAHIGRQGERPTPPLNLVGDFGGGGMLLLVGVLAALLETNVSGVGQVVDAAMVDGVALLLASILGLYNDGRWSLERGSNLLDSGAPFYDTYETSDGRFVAVGAIERRFYEELLRVCDLEDRWPDRSQRSCWPEMREALASVFRSRTRDEWAAIFDATDACVTPVLTLEEVATNPHIAARGTYVSVAGRLQSGAAPRFSRTPEMADLRANALPGEHTDVLLAEIGYDTARREQLRRRGVI